MALKRIFKIKEMSTVGRFNKWIVRVFPSGSDSNPKGGRKEHGPPHFSYLNEEKNFDTKIKIPYEFPEEISDFEFLKNQKIPDRKDLKILLEWLRSKFRHPEMEEEQKSNYKELIGRWNGENPEMLIKDIKDAAGNHIRYEFDGKDTW